MGKIYAIMILFHKTETTRNQGSSNRGYFYDIKIENGIDFFVVTALTRHIIKTKLQEFLLSIQQAKFSNFLN